MKLTLWHRIAIAVLCIAPITYADTVPPPPTKTDLGSIPSWVTWLKKVRNQGNAQEAGIASLERSSTNLLEIVKQLAENSHAQQQVLDAMSDRLSTLETPHALPIYAIDGGTEIPDGTFQRSPSQSVLDQWKYFNTHRLIMGSGMDPNDDGVLDEADWRAWLSDPKNVPAGFDGILMPDWESKWINQLALPVGDPLHDRAVAEGVKCVQIAKSIHPHAQVGLYGIPWVQLDGSGGVTPQWQAMVASWQPIFDAQDIAFPSLYTSDPGDKNATYNAAAVREALKHCKLVYGVFHNRYAWQHHDPWELCQVGPEQQAAGLRAAKDAGMNGACFWEADAFYFLRVAQWPTLPATDTYYSANRRGKYLLASESSPEAYIDRCHLSMLAIMDSTLNGVDHYTHVNPGDLPFTLPADAPPPPPPPPIVPATQPVIVPVNPNITLAPSGPLDVGPGDVTIENKAITSNAPYIPPGSQYFAGGQGISCSNVGTLTMRNCTVKSYRYGIWMDASACVLDHVSINTAPSGAGDGDDYCVRGDVQSWSSNDCTFTNSGAGKGCVRIYGCPSFTSMRDTFSGGRLMLGGGDSNEWVSPRTFTGTISAGKIACTSVQVYLASTVTFNSCDFAGTQEIHVEGKATLKSCTNIPLITKGTGAVVSVTP